MARTHLYVVVAGAVILALAAPSLAADPDPLQDLCVADVKSPIRVNGFVCKANVAPEDFVSAALKNPGNTNNANGAVATAANVLNFQGLNTQGVSMARIDFAPGGLNPPHTHPRATEILFLVKGMLEVGVLTTDNKLFINNITAGETTFFPRGLVHFQQNRGEEPAFAISGFNSQLPGTQVIANTLFNATPPVPPDVLARAFMIDEELVEEIEAKFM